MLLSIDKATCAFGEYTKSEKVGIPIFLVERSRTLLYRKIRRKLERKHDFCLFFFFMNPIMQYRSNQREYKSYKFKINF